MGTTNEGKVNLAVFVTPDLAKKLHAGKIVGEIAKKVGGGGGGRPDLAQAGGKEPDKLPEALTSVPQIIEKFLA